MVFNHSWWWFLWSGHFIIPRDRRVNFRRSERTCCFRHWSSFHSWIYGSWLLFRCISFNVNMKGFDLNSGSFSAWPFSIINHLYFCYSIINCHIDGLHYCFCSLFVDSLRLTASRIPKEDTFIIFRIKLSKIFSIIENVALASEHSEVLHFWLLPIPNFICGLLRSCSKVYSIANVTWNVHSFSPKLLWNLLVE